MKFEVPEHWEDAEKEIVKVRTWDFLDNKQYLNTTPEEYHGSDFIKIVPSVNREQLPDREWVEWELVEFRNRKEGTSVTGVPVRKSKPAPPVPPTRATVKYWGRETITVVNINTIEDLMKLVEKHGKLCIDKKNIYAEEDVDEYDSWGDDR